MTSQLAFLWIPLLPFIDRNLASDRSAKLQYLPSRLLVEKLTCSVNSRLTRQLSDTYILKEAAIFGRLLTVIYDVEGDV